MFFRPLLLIALLAAPAFAQVDMPRDDAAHRRFQVDFTGGVWFPRLAGKTTLGANGTTLNINDLDLNTSQTNFSGQASIAWDRFKVRVGGFDSGVSGRVKLGSAVRIDGLNAPAGSTINSTIDAWSFNTDVSYAIMTPFQERIFPWSDPTVPVSNRRADGRRSVDLAMSLIVGVQVVNIDQQYEIVGVGTATSNNAWVSPYVGFGFELTWISRDTLPLSDHIVISIDTMAGPAFAGGNYTLNLSTGVTIYFLKSLGVTLGYRLSDWSFARGDDSFEEGGLQGLFAGVSYTW